MAKLNLKPAEQIRVQLTLKQQKQIEQIYKGVAKDIDQRIKKIPDVLSAPLQKSYLETLKKQVLEELDKASSGLQDMIEGNMKSVAESVLGSTLDFAQKVGLSVEGLYSHVPDDVIKAVATGQLYDGDWTLSKAIWKDHMKTQYNVNTVVAKGIAENKSAYDIAKDLEKYVDPSAEKPWDWSKVYPGVSKKVDYNAQRLARTMVSHAYQQAFVRSTIKNPFVTKYRWDASNSARVCPICAERDGQLYDKNDLPLDHPNGMCTFEAVIPDSMEDIADRVAVWVSGTPDPELDEWAKSLEHTQAFLSGKDSVKPLSSSSLQKQASVQESILSIDKLGDINKVVNNAGWFTDKTYFQGLSIETTKHITAAYQRIFDRYPQLKGVFPSPKVKLLDNPKAYASCKTMTTGEISVNKTMFSAWDALVKSYSRDVKLGFHPEGTTAESLIIHEFGHSLDGYLGRKLSYTEGTISETLISDSLKKSKTSQSAIGWKVSSYAKKNSKECFAECLAEGLESAEPSALSKEVLKQLDKLLKEAL